ncbi:MAG: N-acetyl-gamma-glutamyl-phosphate reductase [Lactobacillales bacterium]|jgi:N-acetyl-gamma-glutamyl-phosphate reductase|nr:N-acetyl-gamma-glutamyl-phosphate reductase [Lactobacillales bacterium]
MKIAIVGITGYSGIELLRLLDTHPHVEINGLYAFSSAGNELSEHYPHLLGKYQNQIELFDADKIMKESDAVFFATPSGVSKDQSVPFIEADFPVIDLSGDLRLNEEDYKKWYGKDPAPQAILDKAQYSLADLDEVTGKAVSNPGCFATATLLGLAPLVQKGLIKPDTITVDAKSGLSGAGKKLSETSHYSFINENMQMYRVDNHQHIPEILNKLQTWNKDVPYIHFQTSLIPVTRGIMVTTFAKCDASTEQVEAAYNEVYKDAQFVRVQAPGVMPSIKQVVGSNFCDIGFSVNADTHTITVVSVIDNLVKGAAGQAIQNFNKMFGFNEADGLNGLPTFL